MAKDDYLTSTPGGSLRLKGAKDAGVTKKKKKKKSKPPSSPNSGADQKPNKESEDPGKADRELSEDSRIEEGTAAKERAANPAQEVDVEEEEVGGPHVYKTEAERRHEDMRRKRLDERLKREGVKTHKERVEELNRYLSNLSEHHDMPRIGPG